MLAAIQPRREGKVGELRSSRKWPAGRGAFLLSLSAHCLAQCVKRELKIPSREIRIANRACGDGASKNVLSCAQF